MPIHNSYLMLKYRLNQAYLQSKTNLFARASGMAERHSFDARSLLVKLADYSFGTCVLSSVHLSRMRRGQDGYYDCEDAVAV